jgi:iron-sulfur cluster assembly protein
MDIDSSPLGSSRDTPPPVVAQRKYSFSVSAMAVRKVYEALRKRGTLDAALRVGVRGGGCSGFTYVIEFADKPPREKRDLVFEYRVDRVEGDDGEPGSVRVLCDKKSILYLNGTTLDWEKTLMWQGFKFVNPKEKSSCGCNESFAV